MPSHEAEPAALPVGLFVCEMENDRPQPSVRPGGTGVSGVPFAKRGFADGQLSSQARGLSGIWSLNISIGRSELESWSLWKDFDAHL